MQITAYFGLGNATPVFGMVPVRARALLPTITEEDRVVLNNVEKVVKFLTSGTATPAMNGVCILISASMYRQKQMLLCYKVTDLFIFLLAGPECGIHSPRAFTCVAGHLIEDPTGDLEPIVIEGISTSGPRGVFVVFSFSSNRKLHIVFLVFLLQTTQMMIERLQQ
jgi:hypothetical protein